MQRNTKNLIGVQEVLEYGIVTTRGDTLSMFILRPTNLSMLSQQAIAGRVQNLMILLRNLGAVELLALNSRESFENNKAYLRQRMEQEENPALRELLRRDMKHLDQIQLQTATAREFLLVVRWRDVNDTQVWPMLHRIERQIRDQGFEARRADREDLKRILAVYFAQNVTSEHFDDFDGERWFYAQIQTQSEKPAQA